MHAADVDSSLTKIAAQQSVSRLLDVACTQLGELLNVPRVTVSRIIGDLLVEIGHHDRSERTPELELFLVTDYPLTQEVIASGEPRHVSRAEPGADPAEAALLERLGFDTLLMLPLRSRAQNWGLVEIYADGREFTADEIAQARLIVDRVGELLAEIESRP